MAAGRAEFLDGEIESIFFKVVVDKEEMVSVELNISDFLLFFRRAEGGVHEFFDGVHGNENA